MATNNPNSLYSAGNVVFNSQPATQFYLQSMARKRAKQEAVDNYFRDLGNSLTPSGMHPDEVPDFINKVNGYKQFAIQNKDALRNPTIDNGQAAIEANRLYNEALDLSARSKYKVQNLSQIPNLTPDEKERLMDDSFMGMHNASLNVNDPNYKPFDKSMLEYNPKQFSLDDQAKLIENLTKNRKTTTEQTYGATDPKTFMRDKITKSIYQPEDLQNMGAQAATEYASNSSYRKKINDLFNSSYNEKTGEVEIPKEYNDVFKNIYGKDIHTPQELGAAYALANVQQQTVKTERDEDKFAQAKALQSQKLSDQMALAKYNQGLKKDFDSFKKAATKTEQGSIINKMVNDQVNKAVSDIESRKELGTRGYYSMLVPPTILAAFQGSSKNAPIRLGLSKDKQHVFPVYEHLGPNGVVDGETIGDQVPIQEYKTILTDKFLSQKDFAPEIESEGYETGNDNETNELPFQWKK